MFIIKLACPGELQRNVVERERAPTATANVPSVIKKRATLAESDYRPIIG